MSTLKVKLLALAILLAPGSVALADQEITMVFMNGEKQGQVAGKVTVQETKDGLLFTPNLQGLTPGDHGFHIHENPNCGQQGMGAGGHFDPEKTDKHLGPLDAKGHLGDLPILSVNANGSSSTPVLAPRLKKLSEIQNRSLMIHEGSDNYSDTPAKNGGGGGRMLCGAILQDK